MGEDILLDVVPVVAVDEECRFEACVGELVEDFVGGSGWRYIKLRICKRGGNNCLLGGTVVEGEGDYAGLVTICDWGA